MGDWILRNGEMAFNEEDIYAADSNFFSVFSFNLLYGNPDKALVEPNSIVLTKDLAIKYFKSEEAALDQMLTIGNNKDEYTVTGVVENVRSDSHLKFNALLSTRSFDWLNNNNWLNNTLWTYYVVNEGASAADVDAKIEHIMERNVTPVMEQFVGKSLAEFRAEGGIYTLLSFPLYDIHLKSEFEDEPEPPSDMAYVYILTGIGVFIILLACINFMNLTTAKSAGRAKEVGLRKTLGSERYALIGQFLSESMFYAIIAGIVSLGLLYGLMPSFNILEGKSLAITGIFQWEILTTFITVVLLVGILAGSYPAFYLTSFKSTEVLKGKVRSGMKSGNVRSVLVTFQFWISIVLIICTAIVYQQLQFIQDKNLGIDKDHIIVIEDVSRLEDNRIAFKNTTIVSNAFVQGASFSNNPFPGTTNNTVFRYVGSEQDFLAATYFSDYDHVDAMGIEMEEGRFFSRDYPNDTAVVVVNEAAVKEFGWTEPLQQKIQADFLYDTRVSNQIMLYRPFLVIGTSTAMESPFSIRFWMKDMMLNLELSNG